MLNVVADHPGPLPAVTLHARRGGGGAIKKVLLCSFTPVPLSSVRCRHLTKLAPCGKPQNSTITKLSANHSRLVLAPIIVADSVAFQENIAFRLSFPSDQASPILTNFLL